MAKHYHHFYTASNPESWMATHWRPLCGLVYLLICLTDFVFMPAWYEYTNRHFTPENVFTLAAQFKDPIAQVEAMKALHDTRAWKPITLDQSGLIHVSFGAILGVAAWSRGREKISSDQVTIATQTQSPPPPPPTTQTTTTTTVAAADPNAGLGPNP